MTRARSRAHGWLLVGACAWAVVAVAGCGDSSGAADGACSDPQGCHDAGVTPATDAGRDVAPVDAPADAGTDAGSDAPAGDAASDAPAGDAASDAVGADAGGDAASEDAGTDAGDDAASDDAGVDGGLEDAAPDGPTYTFVFSEEPAGAYVRVDRAGVPGRNPLLHLLGDKDALNAADPDDDADLTFLSDVNGSLETWHLGVSGMQTPDNTGLNDDLLGLGLQPCVSPPSGGSNCDDQVMDLLVDVVQIIFTEPLGFPNGRALEEPVGDILLARMLLDLGTEPPDAFLDLDQDGVPGPSLNPLANDVPFATQFPYVAPPH